MAGVKDTIGALIHGRPVNTMDVAKFAGPLAGITFSHGAKGGEALGEYYAAKDRQSTALQMAMPDINSRLKSGDTDGAIHQMVNLGMDKAEIRAKLGGQAAPHMTSGRTATFDRIATPEERARMDADRPQ